MAAGQTRCFALLHSNFADTEATNSTIFLLPTFYFNACHAKSPQPCMV